MKISKEELRQAFIEVREEELAPFLKACEDKELDQQIEASKKRMDREKIHAQTQRRVKRYLGRWTKAAAIFVVVLVGSVSVYAIEKIRQARVEWDAELGQNEDDFRFEADNPVETASAGKPEKIPDRIERRYHPVYIAKGFKEYRENRQDPSYRIIYKKKKERIYFDQMTKTKETTADLGLTDQETVDINGYAGQMGSRGGERILRFVTGQYVFRLSTKAAVEWDEMIRMAESVSKMAPDKIETYYEPVYLPDGYEMTDNINNIDIMISKTYSKRKNIITFGQSVLEVTVSIDSQDMTRETVYINGWKGQLNHKKKKISLVWATNEYIFDLHGEGNVSKEELIKVAESVSPTG